MISLTNIQKRFPAIMLCSGVLCFAACNKNADEEPATPVQPPPSSASTFPGNSAKPATKPPTKNVKPRKPLDLQDLTPETFAGSMVRVYRRQLTTGVITVHQERVADEDAAIERETELVDRGWRSWSPPPAPEKSAPAAAINPELAECPFLLHVTKIPVHGLVTPNIEIKCFQTVENMEDQLYVEERIAYVYARAQPCHELKSRSSADDNLRQKEIRQHCKTLGIKFGPSGVPL